MAYLYWMQIRHLSKPLIFIGSTSIYDKISLGKELPISVKR